jgi:hypothetical protein
MVVKKNIMKNEIFFMTAFADFKGRGVNAGKKVLHYQQIKSIPCSAV